MSNTSSKQTKANQQNALKSTGPKTPAGKAASKLNALKHGLLSQETVLPTEDADTLDKLAKELREELQPVGQLEHFLVDRIVSNMWRLKRLHRIETGLFTTESYGEMASRVRSHISDYEERVDKFPAPEWQDVTITDEEEHAKILEQASELDKLKKSDQTIISQAFTNDAIEYDVLAKITRYEVSLERGLIKALHELQRLQANRLGADTPPPAALDVDITK